MLDPRKIRIQKMVKTYIIRSTQIKLPSDALKDNKPATTKRRKIRKANVIEDEESPTIEVVDVEEHEEEEDVESDVVSTTTKKIKNSVTSRQTSYSKIKPKASATKKHISKKKKAPERPSLS